MVLFEIGFVTLHKHLQYYYHVCKLIYFFRGQKGSYNPKLHSDVVHLISLSTLHCIREGRMGKCKNHYYYIRRSSPNHAHDL